MTIYSRVEPLFRESFQLLYRRFENRSETVSFVPFVFRSENRSKRVKRAETRSETVSSPRNVSCTHMVSRFYLPLLVCPPFCSTAQRLFFSFYSSARPQLEYSIRWEIQALLRSMSNLTHRTIYSSTFNFRLQLLLHVCTVDKIEEILISWNLLSTICMSRAVVICCSIERYASDDTMPRKMVTIIVTCAALGNILSLPSTSRHRADSCTNNESTPNTRPSNSKDGDFGCFSFALDRLLK